MKTTNQIHLRPKHSRANPLTISCASGLASLCLCSLAPASPFTWDGGGNTNGWTHNNNWNPSGAPTNDGSADLHFAGAIRTTSRMNVSYDVNSITFNPGASPFTLRNALGTALTIHGGFQNLDDSVHTIEISAIVLGASQTWNAGTAAGGNLVFSGDSVDLGASQILTIAGSNSTRIDNAISGNSEIQKTGSGTLTLTGANTFSGATQVGVNGGTLTAGAADALKSTSAISVSSGGTLLLAGIGAINRVNDAAGITLAGGTLSMQGLGSASETLGALTLSADSTLDFGTGNTNTLTFDSLSLGSYSLIVTHWTGTNYAPAETTDHSIGTQDRLLFGSLSLSSAQLDRIRFYNDAGSFLGTGHEVSFGSTPEIVPVPEPATILGGLALLGLVGYRERRRFWRKAVRA